MHPSQTERCNCLRRRNVEYSTRNVGIPQTRLSKRLCIHRNKQRKKRRGKGGRSASSGSWGLSRTWFVGSTALPSLEKDLSLHLWKVSYKWIEKGRDGRWRGVHARAESRKQKRRKTRLENTGCKKVVMKLWWGTAHAEIEQKELKAVGSTAETIPLQMVWRLHWKDLLLVPLSCKRSLPATARLTVSSPSSLLPRDAEDAGSSRSCCRSHRQLAPRTYLLLLAATPDRETSCFPELCRGDAGARGHPSFSWPGSLGAEREQWVLLLTSATLLLPGLTYTAFCSCRKPTVTAVPRCATAPTAHPCQPQQRSQARQKSSFLQCLTFLVCLGFKTYSVSYMDFPLPSWKALPVRGELFCCVPAGKWCAGTTATAITY